MTDTPTLTAAQIEALERKFKSQAMRDAALRRGVERLANECRNHSVVSTFADALAHALIADQLDALLRAGEETTK